MLYACVNKEFYLQATSSSQQVVHEGSELFLGRTKENEPLQESVTLHTEHSPKYMLTMEQLAQKHLNKGVTVSI